MDANIAGWLFFRCLRWLCWIAAGLYYLMFAIWPAGHLDTFGHLTYETEFWIFGLPLAGVFMGFFELMMRERTGLPRPAFLRNWLG